MAETLGLSVADICQRFVDASKVLGDPNLVLPAVYFFKENAATKTLQVKNVNGAVTEFLAEHLPTVGT